MSAITLFDLNGEQRFTGTSVGGGGAQPVLTATLHLTSPEILSLDTVRISIVAAPGASKALLPLSAMARWNPGATPYTAEDQTFGVVYASTPGTPMLGTSVFNNYVPAGGDPAFVGLFTDTVTRYALLKGAIPNSFDTGVGPTPDVTIEDDALEAALQAPASAGNGTLDLTLLYSVIDL